MKRRLKIIIAILTIIFPSSALPVLRAMAEQTAMPSQTPAASASQMTIQLAGLHAPVTVRRDERGIPYIEAANESDLYFAQGYVTASDRLWQMDLLRRTARGELSEIFGRVTLEEDRRHRRYGFAVIADATFAQASPTMRASLEAYTRGVNAFIESRTDANLPPEFRLLQYRPRAWRPTDAVAMYKLIDEGFSNSWDRDIARAALSDLSPECMATIRAEVSPLDVIVVGSDGAAPSQSSSPVPMPCRAAASQSINPDALRELASIGEETTRSLARVGLYAEGLAASNNWVVSGRHTVTGKPLLAADPHITASAPSVWHMVHLTTPGLRVAGGTFPGMPGVVVGHNERIAWGFTNLDPDVQDVYLEKFDTADPHRYQTPEGWRTAEVRREEIKVRRNLTNPATETVTLDVTVTRHGPIVFESGGNRYALRWPALDPQAQVFDTVYMIDHARNWEDFRAACRRYPSPTSNFIYADVDGHIGYYGAGRIPIRRTGDGSLPYNGATNEGDWTDFIPFDRLPHVYDPPSGIIVTANNRIVGRDYPYFLTHDWAVPPYRARRIYDLLLAKPRLTMDDFRSIQADLYSIPDAIFTGEVVRMAALLAASSPEWRAMLTAFDGWNGIVSADSRVVPLAVEMRRAFRRHVLAGAVGAARVPMLTFSTTNTLIDRVITTRPREWLPSGFDSYEALLLACYRDARQVLTRRLGADESQWTWGRMGQGRFPHPLADVPLFGASYIIPPIPAFANGSVETVNVGANVSMRLIADPSNWDRTQQGIALGESGDPVSPHWRDQFEDWQRVTPRLFPFTRDAVAGAGREMLVLTPAN